MFVPSVNNQDSMKIVKGEYLIDNKDVVGKQFAHSPAFEDVQVFRIAKVVKQSNYFSSLLSVKTENNDIVKVDANDKIVLEV